MVPSRNRRFFEFVVKRGILEATAAERFPVMPCVRRFPFLRMEMRECLYRGSFPSGRSSGKVKEGEQKMDFGVGHISEAAREVIQAAGGSIEETPVPQLWLVKLPEAEIIKDTDEYVSIFLQGQVALLLFTQGWGLEDCRFDCLERAGEGVRRQAIPEDEASSKRVGEEASSIAWELESIQRKSLAEPYQNRSCHIFS
jgi:hypothetical protein